MEENFLLTSTVDGLPLGCTIIAPEGDIKALVQFSHGMAEHRARYFPLMRELAAAGFATIINDHRGHGDSVRSFADYGYFYDGAADALVADLRQVSEAFRAKYPGKKLFLFGHSMGSLAVRVYAKRNDTALSGLIVCGCPANHVMAQPMRAILGVMRHGACGHWQSKFLDQIISGGLNHRFCDEGSPHAWLNRDKAAVKEYEDDPRCGFLFTINGYYSLLTLMTETYDLRGWRGENPRMPVWFISGGDDPCMGDEKQLREAVDLMKRVGYRSVTQHIYPKMRHEILNEIGHERVYRDIQEKLEAWLSGQK